MFSSSYIRTRFMNDTRIFWSLPGAKADGARPTPKLKGGTLLLLALLALSVQGCLGFGGSSGQQIATGSNGQQVSVNQDVFKGNFYLTINHNLYVLNGNNTTKELVSTGNVYDPAVSPDGKWVAFVQKYKQYSDLCVVSTSGGKVRVLRTGAGKFYYNGPFIHNTYVWYAQPAWSADGSTLLFLSDLEKEDWYQQTGRDAPLLDLQVFSVPFNNPTAKPKDVAYATFGDGGDRDASYRPGHPDQIIYTHYTYDAATQTQQDIQLYMENPNTISAHPGMYYPGSPGGGFDPSIAITTPDLENIQPAFSPDGNAIAYIQRNKNQTQMSLMVMPTPPDSITQTPNDPKTEALALQAYKTQSSHLLSQTYIEQPVWSPDGKQLAYIQYTGGTFDLWIVKINYDAKTQKYSIAGSPIQVTSGGIDGESRPVWTM
jgi:Tol biopolymer transport system component